MDFIGNVIKDNYNVKPCLRRISYVKDPEAKLRVICMFDYLSQTVLKPLHDQVLKILDKFPGDCTYDQGKKLKYTGPYFCFDLSNATDRFPVSFQIQVLESFIGKARAEA